MYERTVQPGRRAYRRRRRLFLVLLCVLAAPFAAAHLKGLGYQDPRLVTVERMAAIEEALDRYAVDNGGLIPTTHQDLRALLEEPQAPENASQADKDSLPRNWRGPYIDGPEAVLDGWGHALRYAAPGGGEAGRPYDVYSFGSDNVKGGKGSAADIESWKPETLTL